MTPTKKSLFRKYCQGSYPLPQIENPGLREHTFRPTNSQDSKFIIKTQINTYDISRTKKTIDYYSPYILLPPKNKEQLQNFKVAMNTLQTLFKTRHFLTNIFNLQ